MNLNTRRIPSSSTLFLSTTITHGPVEFIAPTDFGEIQGLKIFEGGGNSGN